MICVLALGMLTGCPKQDKPDTTTEDISSDSTQSTTAANSQHPTQSAQTSSAEQSKNYNLYNAEFCLYNSHSFRAGELADVDHGVSLDDNTYFSILDSKRISIEQPIAIRNSTNSLVVGSESDSLMYQMKYQTIYYCGNEENVFSSPYKINYNNPIYDVHFEQKQLVEDKVELSYDIYDTVSVYGFVRKMNNEEYEIVIDPAYMYGIPLLTNNMDAMKYCINGTDIFADTLSFTFIYFPYSYPDLDLVSDQYVYAKVSLKYLQVSYTSYKDEENTTQSGYDNYASLDGFEIISEDANLVLEKPFLMPSDKNSDMQEVYDALVSNYDKLITDDTCGIVLLDLDFDGTPEILHSHIRESVDLYDYECSVADIDVYRVRNHNLVYISTMKHVYVPLYNWDYYNKLINYLTLKELEDGTKAWLGTSYIDLDTGKEKVIDYLYQLQGDTLTHVKVFCSEPGNDGSEDLYYYYDHLINEEAVVTPVENNPEISARYEWNGISGNFGYDELYSRARRQFYDDSLCSYRLSSNWLIYENADGYFNPYLHLNYVSFKISERDYSYKMAYLVDQFYLGDYDPAIMDYNYDFFGGYGKPVIYLYPEEETELDVTVEFACGGELTCTYPDYTDGWHVTAMPDGTLYDANGNEYYCLYWEGEGAADFDYSKGFCVKGEDTASFLREKLMYIGLSARETNEFIIYWLPILQKNPYNVITLHTDDYAASVPLTCSVEPDTNIRVFMTYEASDSYVEIEPQELPHYERTGFTLVEWGGSEN